MTGHSFQGDWLTPMVPPAGGTDHFREAPRPASPRYHGNALRAVVVALASGTRRWLLEPAARFYLRWRFEDKLSGMSDRILADIGVRRTQIPALARWAYPLWPGPASGTGQSADVHHLDTSRAVSPKDRGHPPTQHRAAA